MTDKERITEALLKQGIPYTETDNTVTFKTDLWIVDYGFDPDGSLVLHNVDSIGLEPSLHRTR